jgi:uncharacterized protein (TIGR02594 family)
MSLYQVTAQKLNLRKAPSVSGEIIDVLDQDTLVFGVKKVEDEKWLEIQFQANQKGYVSCHYIKPVTENCPPWLEIAVKELLIKEYPGAPDHPRIVQYLKTTTLPSPYDSNDETAWCSSFVNWCMEQASLKGTDNAMARSWQHWGKKLEKPQLGCVVVFKRPPNPQSGHVAFYIGETPTDIKVLGGNQGDEVNVSLYSKERFLEYRGSI